MQLDWDAGHGPVSGPCNAATGSLAVAWAGHAAHMPPVAAAVAAGAGLIGSHIAGRRKGVTGATLALHAAGWLGAGGWCSYALADGPWTQWGIGSLLAGALGFGLAMAGAHHHEVHVAEEKAAAEAAAHRSSLAGQAKEIGREWEARIARVCHASVQIVGVEQWETGAGYTLDGECGPGGLKWKDLRGQSEALAADAKLPEGCGIEVNPGVHRGAFLMQIATVNKLIEDADYPGDHSPLSINGPMPLGVYPDGAPVEVAMRQLSAMIAGQKGSGKTNLLNVMIAGFCRMPDALTWVIDLNGGGVAQKWMRAWIKAGRPGRPPIDWIAGDKHEALRMAKAALAIALARKVAYQQREIDADDDKLPVGPDVPAIEIILDEGAEIHSGKNVGDEVLKELRNILVQIIEIARAAAVNELTTGLRVTQDVISNPQILKQSGLRIGLRMSDDSEIAYLLGWDANVTAEDIPWEGCAFIRVGRDPVKKFKVYRIRPSHLAEVAVQTAALRTELDAISVNADTAGVYATRWERTAHLFESGATPPPAAATAVEQQPNPSAAPLGSGVTADWGTKPVGNPDVQRLLDEADAAKERLRKAADEAVNRDPDLDAQFGDILRGGGIDWSKPSRPSDPTVDLGKKREDPRRQMVFDIVAGAGPAGIGPEAVRDAITRLHPDVEPPHAATIGRWLDADPRVHKPSYGRYAVKPDQER